MRWHPPSARWTDSAPLQFLLVSMCQIFIVLCVYAFSIQILFPVEISDRNGLKLDPLCGLEEAIPGKDREKGEDGHATADYEHRRNSKVTLAATAQGKWFLIILGSYMHRCGWDLTYTRLWHFSLSRSTSSVSSRSLCYPAGHGGVNNYTKFMFSPTPCKTMGSTETRA